MFENRQLAVFEGKCRRFRNSSECLKTHWAVALMIDQFWGKRCQKKHKDGDCNLFYEFFQKCFVVHEQSAVGNSFSTYVCYAPDGLFWLNLYLQGRVAKRILAVMFFFDNYDMLQDIVLKSYIETLHTFIWYNFEANVTDEQFEAQHRQPSGLAQNVLAPDRYLCKIS